MASHMLEPLDIAETPELAVLSLLHSVIDMSIRSLLAAHPELHHGTEQEHDGSPCQAIARTILISTSQLFEPLEAYRKAVAQRQVSSADLPF